MHARLAAALIIACLGAPIVLAQDDPAEALVDTMLDNVAQVRASEPTTPAQERRALYALAKSWEDVYDACTSARDFMDQGIDHGGAAKLCAAMIKIAPARLIDPWRGEAQWHADTAARIEAALDEGELEPGDLDAVIAHIRPLHAAVATRRNEMPDD